jgi:5-methylcytosine-specific restriction endonuclease McrA
VRWVGGKRKMTTSIAVRSSRSRTAPCVGTQLRVLDSPKGQMSLPSTSNRTPLSSKARRPLNYCAYCGSTSSLSTEHIIPYGFGGELILLKAVCEECRTAVADMEDVLLCRYLCALRSHLCLPSRKPQHRPTSYKLALQRGDLCWSQKVQAADHPGVVHFAMFDPPGSGQNIRLVRADIFADTEARLAEFGADTIVEQPQIGAVDLARAIAKIGMSYAVAEFGRDAFAEFYVQHLIRQETPDWNHWVGGYDCGQDILLGSLHDLRFLRRGLDVSVIVHLFVPYCPRFAYEVVVGRLKAVAH